MTTKFDGGERVKNEEQRIHRLIENGEPITDMKILLEADRLRAGEWLMLEERMKSFFSALHHKKYITKPHSCIVEEYLCPHNNSDNFLAIYLAFDTPHHLSKQ